MKIQYMSDLHLEFSDNSRWLKHNELPATGDVLVLAGDIFYLKNKVAPLANFWKWASANYRQVLIVPGNHEYYNYPLAELSQCILDSSNGSIINVI